MSFKLIFIFSLILTCNVVTPQTLDEVMTGIETSLKTIADKTKESYANMCQGCDVCSNHSCSARLRDDIDCEHDFGTPEFCTHCKGRRLEKTESFVQFANLYEVIDPASPITRQTVCLTSKIQQTMLDVRKEDDKLRKWVYIGTSNGVYRNAPGSPDCWPYDPRLRPWYISAFGGAKIVAIVIDNSNNMNLDRLIIAKELANRIVDGLSNADQYLIVSYSNVASESAATFQAGTSLNKSNAKKFIEEITLTNQQASILVGLTKVYDIILATKSATTLNLNADINVIILSSGFYTGNNNIIDNLVTNKTSIIALTKKINFITFSLSNSVEPANILRILACGNRGTYNNINDISEVTGAVDIYYNYIRSGQQNKSAIWTEPYLDFSGLGYITTAALAIYDDTTTPNFLIGVVGIDIRVDDLVEKFGSVSMLTDKFRQASLRSNTGISLSECQLEAIRSNKCLVSTNCENTISTVKMAFTQCPVEFTKVWCEDEATFKIADSIPEERTCCRCILKSSVALIAVGWCLFGVTLFILLAFWCCRNNKEEDQVLSNKIGNTEESRFKNENKEAENKEREGDNQA